MQWFVKIVEGAFAVVKILGILFGVLVLPFLLGGYLAKKFRMPDYGWKIGLILFTLLAGIVMTWYKWPPKRGIDLAGGVILIYEVEPPKEQADTDGKQGADNNGDNNPQSAGSSAAPIDRETFGRLLAALKERLNPGGVKEVVVRPYGVNQVEVIVPGGDESEMETLKRRLIAEGTLEFRIIANTRDDADLIRKADDMPLDQKILRVDNEAMAEWVPVRLGRQNSFLPQSLHTQGDKLPSGPLPPGMRKQEITREIEEGRSEQIEQLEVLVRIDAWDVNGSYLQRSRAEPATGEPGWQVSFTFNNRGGTLFRRLTGANQPAEDGFERSLGIILDGYLYSAPHLQSTIGRHGRITGGFKEDEAKDLAAVLNAGSLPARLKKNPSSEWLVGPTLGADTIRKGEIAIVVSMVLVLAFMLFYYRFAGIVACGALLMNLVLLVGIMCLIEAEFTLAGIAGVVLTVGMAVDGNVLIFERIREEVHRGASLRMAIRNGFSRATTTIVDANLTTLITATVLYVIGTDQIRGFAVTLWLGVVLSMFTAIFCSRVIFDIAEKRRWISHLTMVQALGETRVNFLGSRRLAIGGSLALIAIGLVAVAYRGKGLFDIDFTGGVSVQVVFKEPHSIDQVRDRLSSSELPEDYFPDLAVTNVKQEGEEAGLRFVINTSNDDPEKVKADVEQVFSGELVTNRLTVEKPQAEQPPPPPAEKTASRGGPSSRLLPMGPLMVGYQDEAPAPKPETPATEPKTPTPEPKAEQPTPEAKTEQPKPEAKAEQPKLEPKTEQPKPEPKAEQPTPEAKAEQPKPEAKTEQPKPEAKAEQPKPEAKTEQPKPEAKAEQPKPKPKAEQPKPKPKAEQPKPKPKAEQPAPAAKTKPEGEQPPAKSPVTQRILILERPLNYAALTNVFDEFVQSNEHPERPLSEMPALYPQVQVAEGEWKSLDATNFDPARNTGRYLRWSAEFPLPAAKVDSLLAEVKEKVDTGAHFPSSSAIGGQVAGRTRLQALYAILASLLFIIGYIWVRFQRVMYGLAAVVALIHDVLITLGVLALSYWLYGGLGKLLLIDQFKISLAIVAAFLTIIGYSLNDTIVVFDRIREVRGKSPQLTEGMINSSINQTLSRTLLTSLTTLIVVLILYVAGGEGIHGFAFALVVGVVVGTYSSIFIASPVLLWLASPSKAADTGSKK